MFVNNLEYSLKLLFFRRKVLKNKTTKELKNI
jgi:hypothetical protein